MVSSTAISLIVIAGMIAVIVLALGVINASIYSEATLVETVNGRIVNVTSTQEVTREVTVTSGGQSIVYSQTTVVSGTTYFATALVQVPGPTETTTAYNATTAFRTTETATVPGNMTTIFTYTVPVTMTRTNTQLTVQTVTSVITQTNTQTAFTTMTSMVTHTRSTTVTDSSTPTVTVTSTTTTTSTWG
jgi:hypothetical protein